MFPLINTIFFNTPFKLKLLSYFKKKKHYPYEKFLAEIASFYRYFLLGNFYIIAKLLLITVYYYLFF